MHVVDSIKDEACTYHIFISLHRYPLDQKVAVDEIVTHKLEFEGLVYVEYEVHL